jgi:Type II CAAX prenyl endopeptidase Rce1-like
VRLLLYGSSHQDPNAYLIQGHARPMWATVYSLTLRWMIWAPTGETTYWAYALPQLQVLTGHGWIGLLIVGFWWAGQHYALPLIPDWRFLFFRFLAFLPGVLVLMALYVRTRRLAPLIVAHWPMDIAAALMTAIH